MSDSVHRLVFGSDLDIIFLAIEMHVPGSQVQTPDEWLRYLGARILDQMHQQGRCEVFAARVQIVHPSKLSYPNSVFILQRRPGPLRSIEYKADPSSLLHCGGGGRDARGCAIWCRCQSYPARLGYLEYSVARRVTAGDLGIFHRHLGRCWFRCC